MPIARGSRGGPLVDPRRDGRRNASWRTWLRGELRRLVWNRTAAIEPADAAVVILVPLFQPGSMKRSTPAL
ncbi:MAG: hypothetical protein A2W29_12850 [Gemmatimonadetes bacterium RBG_16_66_8]|nr:MAG: hypothetical protein A2W29_12850 [Gemmatimonadetes bacterium RBG_16_66_8]